MPIQAFGTYPKSINPSLVKHKHQEQQLSLPSVTTAPNQRWATDLRRVWAGLDGWAVLALVIDGHTRELLGWHLVGQI